MGQNAVYVWLVCFNHPRASNEDVSYRMSDCDFSSLSGNEGVEVDTVEEASGENVLHFVARHNLCECMDVLFNALATQVRAV